MRTEKNHCEKILKASQFILWSLNYSSCGKILALIRFHLTFNFMVQERSVLRDVQHQFLSCSAMVLPVISLQRYPTPTLSVQTRCSALVLRLITFPRYPTQGYEIVIFPFLTRCYKTKDPTLEITSIKCM